MINGIKVICTIGPTSFNEDVLERLKDRGVDFFRINLSHTEKEEIEPKIVELKQYGVPVMIDTEGSQIRTGNSKEIEFIEGETVRIYNKDTPCNKNNLSLTPFSCVQKLSEGDLMYLDFNSTLIKISNIQTLHKGYIEGVVLIGGLVGGRKGVHVESEFNFPTFSDKDFFAFEVAKKHNINNFSLSFIRKKEEILEFKKIFRDAFFLTKVETKGAVENIDDLISISPGILIDRGDLSRDVPISIIPFTQEYLIDKARKSGKEVFVATNTLENMAKFLKPMKSEVNDIAKILLDGVTGFVLTKETAVGKYPVETMNMLSSLIKQPEYNGEPPDLEDVSYGLLPKPHGGKLINRVLKNGIQKEKLNSMKKIIVSEEDIMDAEQIAIGSFSPLEGFMGKDDLYSVLDNMRLKNGVIWTLPVILQIKNLNGIGEREEVLLVNSKDNEAYAILHVDEIFPVNKKEVAEKWFGTSNLEHPGVKRFFEGGDFIVGGKIDLIKRRKDPSKTYELTPRQVRQIFFERGWSKVVGFHTRNVIHRSHEFIQLEAMRKERCDGLFIHPIIGKKKKGDFEAQIIINAYEKMAKDFYPRGRSLFSVLATYSRYSGPREAVFTAIVRKNFGCSHFIVGRDHTGVGNFYPADASHRIFDRFSKEELGIIPVRFDRVFYSLEEKRYFHEPEVENYPEDKKAQISGTRARGMLLKGISPPEWFMRPEISQIILDKIAKGGKVFVE